jgi:hypothetical protein
MLTEPAQGRGNLGVGRHCGEPGRELRTVGVTDRDAAGGGEHLEHGRADVGERDVDAGEGERLGVGDQIGEPQAHGGGVAEYPVKDGADGIQVEQGLVDVEDDDRPLRHRGILRRG